MPKTQDEKNREYKNQIQVQIGALVLAGMEDRLLIEELRNEIAELKSVISETEANDAV